MIWRILALLGLLAMAGVGFIVFRPGSAHPPYRLLAMSDPEKRPAVFRNFHELMPSRAIAPSTQPRLWTRIPESLDVSYSWRGKQKTLEEFLTETRAMGFMVLRDGAIVNERYALGTDADSLMTIWSAAKSYTTTMIAIGLHQGRIESLDDRVEKYASGFEGTDYGRISLRHLLMMASGMDFSHTEGFILSDRSWMYMRIQFLDHDMDDFTRNMQANSEPGREFHYLAPDTHVLSAVVRGAWGNEKPYAQIIQEELWEPFGFGGEAFWGQNEAGEEGHAIGQCCLSVRLLEFAQLGQLYLEDGVFRGHQGLPDGWTQMAGRPNAVFQEPSQKGRYPHLGYGLQFWIPVGSDGESMAMGAFGQFLWIDRVNQVVIAQLSAAEQSGSISAEERHRAYRAIAHAVAATRPFEARAARSGARDETQPAAVTIDSD